MGEALRLEGIAKRFGRFAALQDVDFSARYGEVHALLGENGAGKSTLMNVVAGLYAPDEGIVEVAGEAVAFASAKDATRHRIGMVHQHFKLVRQFTVLENLRLFNREMPLEGLRDRALEIADGLGFQLDLGSRVDLLSIVEQQRLEILKVLIAGAEILILDEPTAVLRDEEGAALMDLIGGLARSGKAVILVTHKLHEALHHSDVITIMRGGRKIAELQPAGTTPQALATMIVGESIVERPEPSTHIGPAAVRLSRVSLPGQSGRTGLRDLTMIVREGQIYGVAGVSGNGQEELAGILSGLAEPTEGSVEFDGAGDVAHLSAARLRRLGLSTVPVDRYRHALASRLSVVENFAVRGVLEGRYGGWLRFDRKRAQADAAKAIEGADVQGVRSLNQSAALLSGGNAQKLVIAREFQDPIKVVLAHSPSRGLDVRAGAAVHDRLREARDRGAAVILISDDLDEILLLSDRIGVLVGGTISAEFDTPADRTAIGAAMVTHDRH